MKRICLVAMFSIVVAGLCIIAAAFIRHRWPLIVIGIGELGIGYGWYKMAKLWDEGV